METDLKRIILQCWDGAKLREEDRRLFRKHIEHTKAQWIFITQLNQFRTKNIHSMNSDQAYISVCELIKIVLDVIHT
jgi:hypothetical protein